MRNTTIVLLSVITCLTIIPNNSWANGGLDLTRYKCSQFIADTKDPNNATKVLRSMMMIAWATGYAAAHKRDELRADVGAFRLISEVLGAACRKSPDQQARRIIARAIDGFGNKLR